MRLFLAVMVCACVLAGCDKAPTAEKAATTDAASTPVNSLKMGADGVYLVALGDFPEDMLRDLAQYYRQKYNLDVQLLPKLPEPEATRHIWMWTKQVQAEPLVVSVRAAFPELAHNPRALLIGLTTADIYPGSVNWRYTFTWRTNALHTAVVSSARMDLHYAGEPVDGSDRETRVRKMVTKDIALLYYGKSPSNNPHSVLYNQIGGIEDLDKVGEDF
jgi:predicted Zn-dependent protease